MQKDKKSTVAEILYYLNKEKINYCLGNESLDGISKGDLFMYGPEISLFVFDFSLINRIKLKCHMLSKGLYIRWQTKYKRYKINRKFFKKLSEFYYQDNKPLYLYPSKKMTDSYLFKVRNKKNYYSIQDLSPKDFTYKKYNEWEFLVPKDIKGFVKKYHDNIFSDKYDIYNVTINDKTDKKIMQFLTDVVTIIKKSGIKYWLEGGTCLGAIRDGKLIPWDHDLDVGIEYTNKESIDSLIKNLKKKYYLKIREFPNLNEVWNLGPYRLIKIYQRKHIIFHEELCLDIFIFYKHKLNNNTSKMVYKYVVFNKNGYHPSKYLDTVKSIDFYGSKFNVPNNVEEWLQTKYGSDWKTPKKSWHVLIDDGTLIR